MFAWELHAGSYAPDYNNGILGILTSGKVGVIGSNPMLTYTYLLTMIPTTTSWG